VERLSRFLARNGVASRRRSDELIASGRVQVNGKVVLDPFFRIDPTHDRITFDDRQVHVDSSFLYVILNKPAGYISDLADPRGRRLARDLIDLSGRLYPVGRLDYNSEGLMLFTNDGELANKISHPRYAVTKEYLVKLSEALTANDCRHMRDGVKLSDDTLRVISVTLVKSNPNTAWYRIIISEGKNRMIRRICDALHHPVIQLRRVRIDSIHLGNLKPGRYRFLTEHEVEQLKSRSRERPNTATTPS
jgi:23S rRNA pseudouridine2605 synthase